MRCARIGTLLAAGAVTTAMLAPSVSATTEGLWGSHDGSLVAVADTASCYANGWAFDPDHPDADVTVRVSVDGVTVWSGAAADYRPDVEEAGIGDGTSGFWVELRDLVSPEVEHSVEVEAHDVDLARWEPLEMTPRTLVCSEGIVGTHESPGSALATGDGCLAAGWAFDPDHPDGDVTVRILADGDAVWTGAASDYREDVEAEGIGDGTSGFAVDLTPLVTPAMPHEIRAQGLEPYTGEWLDLDGTPLTVTCTGIDGAHDGTVGIVPRGECVATGWAWDRDAPTTRVRVRVLVDGRVVAETTADELREDVRDAGYGDGYSGWTVSVFGRLTPNREHVLAAEARDTTDKGVWMPLGGDGTTGTLTCTTR